MEVRHLKLSGLVQCTKERTFAGCALLGKHKCFEKKSAFHTIACHKCLNEAMAEEDFSDCCSLAYVLQYPISDIHTYLHKQAMENPHETCELVVCLDFTKPQRCWWALLSRRPPVKPLLCEVASVMITLQYRP